MRRWNGWGDSTVQYPVPAAARARLENWVGAASAPPEAALNELAKKVPASHLPPHPLVEDDPVQRLRHARGQSLPDWLALRYGTVDSFPDGVAFPTGDDDVRALIDYAARHRVHLIPYGGGTSVVGHVNPLAGPRPVLTVALGRLSRLRRFEPESMLATFGAGVSGPELEAQLRARGCTLGHYPQSFEYSTLGGWIATRSSGQQSLGYGRIEELFVGGRLESPAGTLELPATFPASSAGPDLRQLVLGSEGRLGILTEATVRASPLPEAETFFAIFFPDFASGREAVQAIVRARLPLSLLRLSTARETETTLALAGHERLIRLLEGYLALRGAGEEKAMLLAGASGPARLVKEARQETTALAGRHGGVYAGQHFGEQWRKGRFHTPYLRNSLWRLGYGVDTLETAVAWERVPAMMEAIERAIGDAAAGEGERVHIFTHLSHFYRDGSSIYTTYLFRLAADPAVTLRRWQRMKAAASEAILAHGGTISHQHGVGLDHAPYLPAEKGALGMATLRTLQKEYDPAGIMNPGKLSGGQRAGRSPAVARAEAGGGAGGE